MGGDSTIFFFSGSYCKQREGGFTANLSIENLRFATKWCGNDAFWFLSGTFVKSCWNCFLFVLPSRKEVFFQQHSNLRRVGSCTARFPGTQKKVPSIEFNWTSQAELVSLSKDLAPRGPVPGHKSSHKASGLGNLKCVFHDEFPPKRHEVRSQVPSQNKAFGIENLNCVYPWFIHLKDRLGLYLTRSILEVWMTVNYYFLLLFFWGKSMWTDIRASRAYFYTLYFPVSQCDRKYIFKVNLIFAHCHVSLPEGTRFRILYLSFASCWSNHPVPLRRNIGNVPSRFIDMMSVLSVASFWWVGCVCVYMFDHIWQCQKS